MKHKLQLKIQARLDGELPEAESRRLAARIARDPEAARLAADLLCIKQAMRGNETARSLPDSREFYWSKIQRQIQRETAERPPLLPWRARWRRWLVPAAGLALVAGALVLQFRHTRGPAFDEITSTGSGMDAVTFHDQSARMTIVWLQDNTPAPPANVQIQKIPAPIQDNIDPGIDLE